MQTDIRFQGRTADRIAEIERWVALRLGGCRHERRVMGIAARLFDLTASEHGLPPSFRRLLRIGALVHDVGRTGGARRHHIRGARMILANRSLPMRSDERETAAFLTRYHRKTVPSKAEIRQAAPGTPAYALRVLLAILRAADALDSRRVVSSALVMRLAGRRLRVKCFVNGDPVRAERAFNKKRKFRMLEETLGISAKVQLRRYSAAGV